ncbi:MAG: hypothetical protein OSJ64_08220 [Firmicutes bacterium]|nr:hypothetical protein [Bacillota bacterium]
MSLPNPEPREIVVQLRWLGLRLWQRQDFFGFTEDSLALAEFVGKQPECQHICDLGSGSGGLGQKSASHLPGIGNYTGKCGAGRAQ